MRHGGRRSEPGLYSDRSTSSTTHCGTLTAQRPSSRTGDSGNPGWNLSDPAGKGTRELVAKFFAYTAKLGGLYADGWDGAFSDNWIYGVIGQSWAYGPNLDTDRDGNVDDYTALRKRWDDGLEETKWASESAPFSLARSSEATATGIR